MGNREDLGQKVGGSNPVMAGQGFFHQESSVKTLNPFKVILSEYNLDCMGEVQNLVPSFVVQVTDALFLIK